jgi:hypothetical protein
LAFKNGVIVGEELNIEGAKLSLAITDADSSTYTLELDFNITVDLEPATTKVAPTSAHELAAAVEADATLLDVSVDYVDTEAATIAAILVEVSDQLEAEVTDTGVTITASAVSSSLAFKNGVIVGEELNIEGAKLSLAITDADSSTYTLELDFNITVTGILTPIS